MNRVLIADDHPLLREGLKQIVAGIPDVQVTGEAATGQAVLDLVCTAEFDLVVVDITMPGISGLEVLRRLRLERPALPVIVLSVHSEDQYARRVLMMGAAGFVSKQSASREFERAIRKVVSGGRYVSRSFAEKLADDLGQDPEKRPHDELSDREHEVLLMIASGETPTGIAGKLGLSPKTIATYRTRLLQKLRMTTNADLIHYAIREKIVD